MAARQPPPSSASAPAAGLSMKEYLKKYQSGPGADGDQKKAKKKTKKKPKPAAGGGGVLIVDEDPVWQKPVQVDEEPASSGDEKPLVDEDIEVKRMRRLEAIRAARPYNAIAEDGSGWVTVAAPEEQGGGSTRQRRNDSPSPERGGAVREDLSPVRRRQRRDTPSPVQGDATGKDLSPPRQRRRRQDTPSPKRSGAGDQDDMSPPRKSRRKKDPSPPRKGARHISGEPQDIWLPRKHVRLDSDETDLEECGGARREQGDDAGSGFSPLRQRQRHQDTAMGSVEEIDCWPPRKGAHLIDETDSEESEDEMSTFAPQELLLDVKGAKALFRDKEDAYLKFVFRSRSKREGKVWHCVCKATNSPKPKLVFGLPKFHCACGSKFLQNNNLDFSLADVRVNFELVVSRIFDQKGPHCIANACCQAMLIMHTMDCITKKKEVKEAMVNINPEGLASSYSNKYPLMEPGVEIEKIPPSSIHKFIKMALMLKNNGIELEDGTFWRIGDISFIDKDNYEEICAELANGVPLLAVITPGVNFEYLKYCEVYRPPLLQDLHECNDLHEPKDKHQAHMVVLIGPAFKANGKNPGRSYYFVNSHANWCEREVYETYHEEAGDIKKPVHYGIGKIEEKGLVYSVIKLWKFGQTAGPGSVTLEDEDEGEAGKYENKIANKQKFTGQYRP